MRSPKKEKRIPGILTHVGKLASGNFNEYLEISNNLDEIDAISAGLNQLSDALQLRDNAIHHNQVQLKHLLRILRQYLNHDFSEPTPRFESKQGLDKSTNGLRELVEDLVDILNDLNRARAKLKSRAALNVEVAK